MTDTEQTARNFTAKAIRLIVSSREGELATLDMLDAEYGDAGREARQKAREFAQESLAHNRAALALKGEE